MAEKTLTERMARLEGEGFKLRARRLADQVLEGANITKPDGQPYGPNEIPSELMMVLVYDKGRPIYLIYERK